MAFECVTWTNKETAMNNAKKHVFIIYLKSFLKC